MKGANEGWGEWTNVLTNGSKSSAGWLGPPLKSVSKSQPVSNFPIHLRPLSPCPFIVHLCQGHLGDDSQHDLLPLRWIRVLLVLVQPSLMVYISS